MQELDEQQLTYLKWRRYVEEELKKMKPTFEQVIKAVLQSVDLEKQEDTPTANTPAELVAQADSLLQTKGEMTKPFHGSISIIDPNEHDFLRLPHVRVEIGGRDIDIRLEELVCTDPNNPEKSSKKYYFGVGLRVGDDYMQTSQALTIDNNGVNLTNGGHLDVPDGLQRISRILTKADRALSPKV